MDSDDPGAPDESRDSNEGLEPDKSQPLDAALADAAREAVQSPDVLEAIDRAARRQDLGAGVLAGLTGRPTSAATRAVDAALADAAREAVQSPDVLEAIDRAARRQDLGAGVLAGLTGRPTSAATRAVDAALADAAREAVQSPDVLEAIDRAARRQDLEAGVLAGLTGRPTSAATRAVDAALADAARSAVLSPDVSETLRLAARRGVARANPTDPALLFALERSRAPEIDAPEDEPKSPEAPHDRTIASVGSFSPDFEGPGSFFAAYELVINSFAELTNSVQALAAARRELTFVWRGQQNAEWGLHSSLYRKLMTHYGLTVAPTSPGEPAVQRFPDEADMLAAELAILDEAVEWRMSDTSALELLARLQHQGGPSRLLDVTRNPLIAAWFAVEAGTADDSDARLFALATGPVLESRDRPTDPPVISEVLAGSRYPFWAYNSPEDRVSAAWGTGSRRRIWIPPAYDARIAAQNAAFLLEGVPMLTKKTMRLFLNPNGRQFSPVDVAASMSVYARPVHPHSRPRPIKANLAPIFSFRIAASAKEEIREMLERTYGFSSSLIYPDIQGMSNRLQTRSEWIGERT